MIELYTAIISQGDCKNCTFFLSDLFSKGFVYKPFAFDTPRLSSKEEYRLFKITKNAKYIEKELLEACPSPEDLILLLKDKLIKVGDSHIYSTFNGFSPPFSKSIDTTEKDPVKTKLKKDSLFEFYVKSDFELSSLLNKELYINGYPFAVEGVSAIQSKNARSSLLLAAMKTDANSKNLPAKAFRIGYSQKSDTQFFLPGSVFESFTPNLHDNPAPYLFDCNL